MATKLSRKDVPAEWSGYPSPGSARERRIAELRALVASGTYKVNLGHLATALIQRGGLMHGADHHAAN